MAWYLVSPTELIVISTVALSLPIAFVAAMVYVFLATSSPVGVPDIVQVFVLKLKPVDNCVSILQLVIAPPAFVNLNGSILVSNLKIYV